jgi:hypothetical protein
MVERRHCGRALVLLSVLAGLGCGGAGPDSGAEGNNSGKGDDLDGDENGETIIDHMGRVEPNNWMLREDDVKSAYNHEDVFAIGRVLAAERAGTTGALLPEDDGLLQRLAIYREAMLAGLAELDSMDALDVEVDLDELDGFGDIVDKNADWPDPHPLVDLMLANYLVVDLGTPCNAYRNPDRVEDAIESGELVLLADEDERNYNIVHSNYFAVELAAFHGAAHHTCGGRFMDEDTIDRTLTLFINGTERDGDPELVRRDGVDSPHRPFRDTFPYVGR